MSTIEEQAVKDYAMTDSLSNSYKSKQKKLEAQKEKKEIKPVVKGKVTKKKNLGRKVSNSIINEEFKNVKNYVVMDVLIPAVKKAISDIITNGIDMLLYGETKSRRSSNASHVSYSNYYDREDRFGRSRNRVVSRRSMAYSYDDIIMESISEAEEVLDGLYNLLDRYHIVSVADFYDLVGVTGEYTDNRYGWTNLASAEVVRVRDGYMLKLPKALPID